MRSVYAKVLLWCFGTLVFSLLAFAVIGAAGAVRAFGHGGPFEKTSTWQLREAREAYESGGAPKLQDYLERVDQHFGAEHHLTDIAGKDLVTGEDRSAWLTQKQPRPLPWPFGMFRDLGHRGEVHVDGIARFRFRAIPLDRRAAARELRSVDFLAVLSAGIRRAGVAVLAAGGKPGDSFTLARPDRGSVRPRRSFRPRSFAAP